MTVVSAVSGDNRVPIKERSRRAAWCSS